MISGLWVGLFFSLLQGALQVIAQMVRRIDGLVERLNTPWLPSVQRSQFY
jgi:hypothetical protein